MSLFCILMVWHQSISSHNVEQSLIIPKALHYNLPLSDKSNWHRSTAQEDNNMERTSSRFHIMLAVYNIAWAMGACYGVHEL